MGDHPVTGQLSSLSAHDTWRADAPGKIGSANTEKAPNRVSFLFPIKRAGRRARRSAVLPI